MSKSRVRKFNQDEEEEEAMATASQSRIPNDRPYFTASRGGARRDRNTVPSLFELNLDKQYQACTQYVVRNLRKLVGNVPPAVDPSSPAPTFAFYGAVADAQRNLLEAIRRFGGPKQAIVMAFGSNDMFTQAMPGLVDQSEEEQQVDNFLPHLLGIDLAKVRQVIAGGTSCACLDWSGKAFTWGSSDQGVLGRNNRDNIPSDLFGATPMEVHELTRFPGGSDYGKITQIDMGSMHTILLVEGGHVYFCGAFKDSDSGMWSVADPFFSPSGEAPPEPPVVMEEHTDPTTGRKTTRMKEVIKQPDTYGIRGGKNLPVHIPSLKNIIAVFSGGNFCAVLDEDRVLYTFGFGCTGELARSAGMTVAKPDGTYELKTAFMKNVKEPTHGWYHMNKLRDLYLKPAPVHFAVPGRPKVLNVACGDIHLLVTALDVQGRVRLYSSGHNNYGQLGHGDTKQRHALTPVEFFDKVIVGQIAAGQCHSLALTAGGDALFAWGRADYGQLGFGKAAKRTAGARQLSPKRVPIPEGTIMSQVVAGECTSAVITDDARLYTWGYEGVTGHGGKYLNEEDCTSPLELKIDGVSRIHSLNMGSQFGVLLVEKSNEKVGAETSSEPQTKRMKRS